MEGPSDDHGKLNKWGQERQISYDFIQTWTLDFWKMTWKQRWDHWEEKGDQQGGKRGVGEDKVNKNKRQDTHKLELCNTAHYVVHEYKLIMKWAGI